MEIYELNDNINLNNISLDNPHSVQGGSFFTKILSELKPFILANRIEIQNIEEITLTDKAGDFYIVPFSGLIQSAKMLKELCESFESNHHLGRLVDIDIFNEQGFPISSGKKKPCYYCGEFSAVSCMRNKRHSYEEIRTKLFNEVALFLKTKKKKSVINDCVSKDYEPLYSIYESFYSVYPHDVCSYIS